MMKTLLAAGLAALIAAGTYSSAAYAQAPAPGTVWLAVSYADLDLSTEAGVRKLDRRLRSAVESACGPISSADPAGANDVRDCRETALAAARAQRETAIAAFRQAQRTEVASN